jgi:hypothetical protein
VFVQTKSPKLVLPCKDCQRPVSDSETNAYRLIAGVLYGWCDKCFQNRPIPATISNKK